VLSPNLPALPSKTVVNPLLPRTERWTTTRSEALDELQTRLLALGVLRSLTWLRTGGVASYANCAVESALFPAMSVQPPTTVADPLSGPW
jgi:hypothetical protein